MRTRRRFAANLESLEGKALLSTLPIMTQNAFNQVLHQIDRAAGTFAKTHNARPFDAALSQISRKVPFGHDQLFPTWQADESIYDSDGPRLRPADGPAAQGRPQGLRPDLRRRRVDARPRQLSSVASTATATGTAVRPVLSHQTYKNALKQIDRAAGTFAKTHNPSRSTRPSRRSAARSPSATTSSSRPGRATSRSTTPPSPAPAWQMVKQLKADLKDYVTTSIAPPASATAEPMEHRGSKARRERSSPPRSARLAPTATVL